MAGSAGQSVVRSAELLAGVRADTGLQRFAQKLLTKTDPPGTPYSKVRLGFVTGYDPATHTCTAKIGDQTVSVSGIPILAGATPVLNAAGQFLQVSSERTTQYTLIGMLLQAPGSFRIRKTADQVVTNSATAVQDTHLKFYGLAGRSYIYDVLLLVAQNGTTLLSDVRAGWIMPSGATFSGGAIGPISSLAASASGSESTGAGSNWRAQVNTVGTFPYGTDPHPTGPDPTDNYPIMVRMQGSLKLNSTAGWCYVAWAQQTAQPSINTTVKEGSFLKVDITSE